MKLNIQNVPPIEKLEKTIKKITKYTIKQLGYSPKRAEIGVIFVGKDEMKKLNHRHRGKDSVTDVLSFPYIKLTSNSKLNKQTFSAEYNPATSTVLIGDVIVCYDLAEEQAAEFSHSIMREICFLIVHGLLHIFGFDHIDEQDRISMRAMEEKVLKKVKLGRK